MNPTFKKRAKLVGDILMYVILVLFLAAMFGAFGCSQDPDLGLPVQNIDLAKSADLTVQSDLAQTPDLSQTCTVSTPLGSPIDLGIGTPHVASAVALDGKRTVFVVREYPAQVGPNRVQVIWFDTKGNELERQLLPESVGEWVEWVVGSTDGSYLIYTAKQKNLVRVTRLDRWQVGPIAITANTRFYSADGLTASAVHVDNSFKVVYETMQIGYPTPALQVNDSMASLSQVDQVDGVGIRVGGKSYYVSTQYRSVFPVVESAFLWNNNGSPEGHLLNNARADLGCYERMSCGAPHPYSYSGPFYVDGKLLATFIFNSTDVVRKTQIHFFDIAKQRSYPPLETNEFMTSVTPLPRGGWGAIEVPATKNGMVVHTYSLFDLDTRSGAKTKTVVVREDGLTFARSLAATDGTWAVAWQENQRSLIQFSCL